MGTTNSTATVKQVPFAGDGGALVKSVSLEGNVGHKEAMSGCPMHKNNIASQDITADCSASSSHDDKQPIDPANMVFFDDHIYEHLFPVHNVLDFFLFFFFHVTLK